MLQERRYAIDYHQLVQPMTFTATTTAANETVTITQLTVDRPTVLDWGDGQWQELPADSTAAINHMYATPGTYDVRLANARAVTALQLGNAKLGRLDTAQLYHSAITIFNVSYVTNSTIDSAHMIGWRPAGWLLANMPSSGRYVITSAHMINWRPASWRMYSMPTGNYSVNSADMIDWRPTNWICSMPAGNYSINSAHMVDWRPTNYQLYVPSGSHIINSAHMADWRPTTYQTYSMPVGSTSWTLAANHFAGWVGCNNFQCQNNGFNTTQVNTLLWGMYQAATARTATGGTINVGGTNAAPSGTFQAAASCPVTAATPGKEVAHELLNNGCGGINLGRVWATVTFTA